MLQPLPYYWGGRGPLVTTPGASGWPGFGARWPAYRETLPPVAPMDVPVYPGRRTPATPAEPHAMLPPSLVPPAIKAPKQGE
jgi:hypothetical protein